MKALEILKRLQNSDYFDRKKLGLPKEYTLDSAIAELEEAIKPKENEWCWFYNESHPVLARLLRIENDEFIAIESDMIGNRYYKYCEPFIGKLPSFMNDIKDK